MARRPIRGPAGNQEDDVNVTPLLDIVFIMLIFFIVTSTFIKEPGVDPERPLVETQVEKRRVAILVGITEDNEIWVNNEQVELSELRFAIGELRRETPQGGAVVQADVGSRSQTLIDVLEIVSDVGIDDVAVSTELL